MSSSAEPTQFLSDVPLFDDLDDMERRTVGDLCKARTFEADTTLMRQGEAGTSLFIIVSGTVDVIVGHDDQSAVVARLGPRDILGELALVDRAARSASAIATTNVEVLELPSERFDALSATAHMAASKVLRRLIVLMCERLREMNLRIDAALQGADVDAPERTDTGNDAAAGARWTQYPALVRRILGRMWN